MEFSDVVRRRRMVRRFDPDVPVPHDALRRALRAATRAPSAGFSQGWDFVVLRGVARTRYWEVTRALAPGGRDPWADGVATAPVLVLCLSDPDAYLDRYAEPDKGWVDRDEARWPIPYWDVDVGMAALLMLLSAVDDGLGALFFGVPAAAHDAVRAAFGIPDRRRLVGVVALGRPIPHRPSRSLARGRRRLSEVVHEGSFGTPYDPPTPRPPA